MNDQKPEESGIHSWVKVTVSQMSYSLVVMLELNGVSEVQYKEIMIIGDE